MVDLDNFGEAPDGTEGLINAVSLTKHHKVSWEAGAPFQTLTSPDGLRYVLIARAVPVPLIDPTLPPGWALSKATLADPFSVSLDGQVTVLRMDNEDSFQGPLDADLVIPVVED